MTALKITPIALFIICCYITFPFSCSKINANDTPTSGIQKDLNDFIMVRLTRAHGVIAPFVFQSQHLNHSAIVSRVKTRSLDPKVTIPIMVQNSNQSK